MYNYLNAALADREADWYFIISEEFVELLDKNVTIEATHWLVLPRQPQVKTYIKAKKAINGFLDAIKPDIVYSILAPSYFTFKYPEVWNATYNYVMLLKAWCVCDAIQRDDASGMVAWLDFGYNHGGDPIDKNSDFNFEWSYNFPEKINLFTIQDLDNRPMFDIIMSMDTYIMGGVIVGVDKFWDEFWDLIKQSVFEITNCGLMDDDQNMLLMAYRKKPELFALHKSYWSVQLKQFGGNHLQWSKSYLVRTKPSLKNRLRAVVKWCKHKKDCFLFIVRVYKHLSKIRIH